jgi:hypothetical protein
MKRTPTRERFFRRLLLGSAPLWIWALHFFGAYALVASACCTALQRTDWFGVPALRVALWALSALAVMAIAALLLKSRPLPRGLLRSAAVLGGLLALLGVVWTTLPMLAALPLCDCTR